MSTPSVPDGFLANVAFVDNPHFDRATTEDLLNLIDEDTEYGGLFLVDAVTLGSDEWPAVCVGLRGTERGQTFRVVVDELWAVENNLALGTMDFADFARSAERDGIFRGF